MDFDLYFVMGKNEKKKSWNCNLKLYSSPPIIFIYSPVNHTQVPIPIAYGYIIIIKRSEPLNIKVDFDFF